MDVESHCDTTFDKLVNGDGISAVATIEDVKLESKQKGGSYGDEGRFHGR